MLNAVENICAFVFFISLLAVNYDAYKTVSLRTAVADPGATQAAPSALSKYFQLKK